MFIISPQILSVVKFRYTIFQTEVVLANTSKALYILIGILALVIFALFMYADRIFPFISKLFFSFIAAVKAIFSKHKVQNITDDYKLDRAIAAAGYAYDKKQDVFYSKMNAWQRQMGYCRLYDEAAPTFGMIMDSEPIFFEYDNSKWLIEFWKGQYDLTCGAEVGVYISKKQEVNAAGIFKGTFYDCVSNSDMLYMKYVLKRNGKTFIVRKGRHWWLTGFRLGEFARPDELTMDIEITLKSTSMLNAFVEGLSKAGYKEEEVTIYNNTISLEFNKPRTKQPFTRSEKTDEIILNNSKLLCSTYQEITAPYETLPDKVVAVRNSAPHVYKHIINIGKKEQIFWNHDIIDKYIGGDAKEKTMTEITNIFNSAKTIPFDNSSKFIIMSDAHRGVGKRSDDFIKNSEVFFTAIKKYYNDGFTLFELGDGEELWENRSIRRIIDTYIDIYLVFKKFHREGRLYFVYGNHDKVKKSEYYTQDNMYKYYDWQRGSYRILFKNLKTYEALVLKHTTYEGNILLLHGHQVDFFNDKLWYLARFLSRYLWKPLEHLGIQDPTRTAKKYTKKISVERKLTEWAINSNHMIIAGHTHKPAFPDIGTPKYFNDGSCVNPSGITAIEIENGKISLVKWSYKTDDSNKTYIDKDTLKGPVEIEKYFEGISHGEKTTA